MNEIRYETRISNINHKLPTVFLAGPTVRGNQQHLQPSWRFEACKYLREFGFSGNVIIPEFTDVTQSDKDEEDWIVPWEMEGMQAADLILFWVPRTKELIGLNTNFELGYWLGFSSEKVVYGRPEGSYRTKYLDIMFNIYGDDFEIIYDNLKGLCEHVYNCLDAPVGQYFEMEKELGQSLTPH